MTGNQHGQPNSPAVSRQRLVDLTAYESRTTKIRRLGVTVEWRSLDWLDVAGCADSTAATPSTCSQCPVVAECLAAALASDDPAEWRGGLERADRDTPLGSHRPHLQRHPRPRESAARRRHSCPSRPARASETTLAIRTGDRP